MEATLSLGITSFMELGTHFMASVLGSSTSSSLPSLSCGVTMDDGTELTRMYFDPTDASLKECAGTDWIGTYELEYNRVGCSVCGDVVCSFVCLFEISNSCCLVCIANKCWECIPQQHSKRYGIFLNPRLDSIIHHYTNYSFHFVVGTLVCMGTPWSVGTKTSLDEHFFSSHHDTSNQGKIRCDHDELYAFCGHCDYGPMHIKR